MISAAEEEVVVVVVVELDEDPPEEEEEVEPEELFVGGGTGGNGGRVVVLTPPVEEVEVVVVVVDWDPDWEDPPLLDSLAKLLMAARAEGSVASILAISIREKLGNSACRRWRAAGGIRLRISRLAVEVVVVVEVVVWPEGGKLGCGITGCGITGCGVTGCGMGGGRVTTLWI